MAPIVWISRNVRSRWGSTVDSIWEGDTADGSRIRAKQPCYINKALWQKMGDSGIYNWLL